jgi:hypothetical protein
MRNASVFVGKAEFGNPLSKVGMLIEGMSTRKLI